MMLEIKDKEASAVKALGILRELSLVPPAPAGYESPVFAPRPILTDAEGRPATAPKPRKKASLAATTDATEPTPDTPTKPRRPRKASPSDSSLSS